jgi:hypothetical protein
MCMGEFGGVGCISPPYPNRLVNGAGKKQLRTRGGTCVESDRTDFVIMANEEGINPALRGILDRQQQY